MNEFFEKLVGSIVSVNIENIEKTGKFTIKMFKHKYSSHKYETPSLFIDDEFIKPRVTKVKYLCDCGEIRNILVVKFLKKDGLFCNKCKEMVDCKRMKQSEYMKDTFKNNGRVVKKYREKIIEKKLTLNEIIENSLIEFNNETDEYKESFYSNHVTNEEFVNKNDSIISINNVMIQDLIFIPIYRLYNSHKYCQKIYDKVNDRILSFKNITYICKCCGDIFESSTSRLPANKIKNHKILCSDCALSNKTFKMRNILNINGDKITYQSKPELDLINYCNINNIIIENGPKVKFMFNDKERTYKIDFMIRDLNILIEIKDNHIWHKKQVESGRWKLKENSAKDYCIKNNMKYHLIFPENIEELKKIIIKI